MFCSGLCLILLSSMDVVVILLYLAISLAVDLVQPLPYGAVALTARPSNIVVVVFLAFTDVASLLEKI